MNARMMVGGLAMTALVGGLASCGGDGFEDYYSGSGGPQISGLEPAFEPGNAGGQEVVISGANFGEDPDQLVVLMDNHNAEIVSVSNNELVVRTPSGPVTGGGVEVLVANPQGYQLLTPNGTYAPYRYGTSVFDSAGEPLNESSFYQNQQYYVQVSNLYDSCYGGRGTAGCEGNAFNGDVGIAGQSEFFRFAYPRLHTTSLGWLTSYDASPNEWRIGPPQAVFPSGIDDLRRRFDAGSNEIRLTKPEGGPICVDTSESLDRATGPCTGGIFEVEYDVGELNFCETRDGDGIRTGEYQPDWPVNQDFFESLPGEGLKVDLDVIGLQISDEPINLPPKVDFEAEFGFDVPAGNPWSVAPPVDCADGNDDGEITIDEDGIVLSWTPLGDEYANNEDINSFVHVSFTFVDFAWYSLEQEGVRASIVVPDNNEVGEDGRARIRIPNEVLYQLPTPNLQWSTSTQQTGSLGEYSDDPSYLFMEAYRVTDYRIPVPRTAGEDLIFSYATGELTILAEFSNPLDRDDGCGDCIDNDGDGWTDDLDPDCNPLYGDPDGGEIGFNDDFTCNNGEDDNNNGDVDAEDELCESGWDGESSCTDGLDNDDDGWFDELDPDCIAGGDENGTELGGTCNDGLDNDGDGWADAQDPGCVNGDGTEDDGLSGTPCNDGIDNDGHGDIDSDDIYCILNGGGAASEEPPRVAACGNRRDDDGDRYVDGFDPDCETRSYSQEYGLSFDPEDEETVLVPGCYDGIDNDGDGLRDAQDPGCWNPDLGFNPDGFLFDEGANRGTTCSDNVDSDGDGWIDGLDPDCVAGDPEQQTELGFGTTECNDGIDNDGDGDIDSDDSLCSRGGANFEG